MESADGLCGNMVKLKVRSYFILESLQVMTDSIATSNACEILA